MLLPGAANDCELNLQNYEPKQPFSPLKCLSHVFIQVTKSKHTASDTTNSLLPKYTITYHPKQKAAEPHIYNANSMVSEPSAQTLATLILGY